MFEMDVPRPTSDAATHRIVLLEKFSLAVKYIQNYDDSSATLYWQTEPLLNREQLSWAVWSNPIMLIFKWNCFWTRGVLVHTCLVFYVIKDALEIPFFWPIRCLLLRVSRKWAPRIRNSPPKLAWQRDRTKGARLAPETHPNSLRTL